MAKSKKKTRPPMFERLREGLQEGIEFAKGTADLRTTVVPEEPPSVTAEEVVEIRQRIGISQAVFARLLNVSTKTVQSWEQGLRQPSQSSLRLLQIVGHRPDIIYEIAGASRNVGQKKRGAGRDLARRSSRKRRDRQQA